MRAFAIWLTLIGITYSVSILQIYSLYRFNSIRNLLIIQKRYPVMVITEAIVLIIWLLIIAPIWINWLTEAIPFDITIAWSVNTMAQHFIGCTELARLWLVAYNLHYLHSSQNEQWKSQIDYKFAEKDWYLKHRNTYGNSKYIIIRVFIYWVCQQCIINTLYSLDPIYGESAYAFFYLIGTVTGIIIYYQCRHYASLKDNFLFYYEFRVTTIIWCLCFIFGLLELWVLRIVFPLSQQIFVPLNMIIALATPSLLSTLWIPYKILLNNIWIEGSSNTEAMIEKNIQMNAMTNDTMSQDDTTETKLYVLLKNENRFQLFVEWMYREFSSEVILCFLEFVQFKEYMVQSIENNSHDSDFKYINLLYSNVPKSSIVYGKYEELNSDININERCKNIADALYQKYIKNDAEFEVNIGANLRRKYQRYAEGNWNLEISEFVNVFDALINEMFLFMRNSFNRYD